MIATISSFIVGTIVAGASIFALVSGTVGSPSVNPADKPVITYGSNS